MRKIYILAIMLLIISIATVKLTYLSYGENPFTPDGRKFEPVPTGHTPGKDNGKDSGKSGGTEFHMAGEDCGICHNPGGKAAGQDNKYVFTMAGTIYKDRTGREPLQGAEIILKDVNGNVISMTSNAAGNFFTYMPIASDPQGWDPTKTEEENKANPSTLRYKAWVKYGDYAAPMATIAPVGGLSAPRMSCNMHHSPYGSRGALFGGGRSTLPAYPSADLSFKKHVMPILKNKCKACHMPASASPTVTYPTGSAPFDYSGTLDLSAYDKDPASKMGIANVINTLNPGASKLLTVSMPGSQHAGGGHWTDNDADYKAIEQWIAEGAKDN